jgi:succinate dehydrogenase flavin-adding protein (antitoxin of CptAB toxin-antitoxin module)
VPYLTPAELDEYEVLLKVETIDIYNYVSGKDVLPPYLADLGVMHKLQAYAKRGNMDSPEGYKKMKEDANLT